MHPPPKFLLGRKNVFRKIDVPKKTNYSLYLLIDTSTYLSSVQEIDLNMLKPFLGLDDNPLNGSNFTLATISDLHYNKVYSKSVPSTNLLSSNKFVRKKLIKQFYYNIDSIIHCIKTSDLKLTNGSKILYRITRAIEQLSNESTGIKSLIIYSDLVEHSNHFSLYNHETLKVLQHYPDSILRLTQLSKIQSDLSGFVIYFIHSPRDKIDDNRFTIISQSLKLFLESKGAVVKVTANLQSDGEF